MYGPVFLSFHPFQAFQAFQAFRENRKIRSIAVNSVEINMDMMQQESLKLLDSFGGHLAQTQQ